MDKRELRSKLLRESSVAGNPEFELSQLRRAQAGQESPDIHTVTVTCGEFMTIVCC